MAWPTFPVAPVTRTRMRASYGRRLVDLRAEAGLPPDLRARLERGARAWKQPSQHLLRHAYPLSAALPSRLTGQSAEPGFAPEARFGRGEDMRAAAVQLNSTDEYDRNLEVAERLVRGAAADGAELVVLPEKWTVLGSPQALRSCAEPLDGPALTAAAGWARELGHPPGRGQRRRSWFRTTRSSPTPRSCSAPTARSRPSTARSTCSTSRSAASTYRESGRRGGGRGDRRGRGRRASWSGSASATTFASRSSTGSWRSGRSPDHRPRPPSPSGPVAITGRS